VAGEITSSCQSEGCWLNFKDPEGGEVFVDWNHEFNIPIQNYEGKTAFVEGTAVFDTISVEELKHFALDEGKSKAEIDSITQPAFQLTIRATGVRL
jgi:hypothetical protein